MKYLPTLEPKSFFSKVKKKKKDVPRQVKADFAISVFVNIVLQHVQSFNFHQQVTRLMLGIVGHVVGNYLLHKLQQRLLLCFVIFLNLLPLFRHLTS